MKSLSALPLALTLSIAPVHESQASYTIHNMKFATDMVLLCGKGPYEYGSECDTTSALKDGGHIQFTPFVDSGDHYTCLDGVCVPEDRKTISAPGDKKE